MQEVPESSQSLENQLDNSQQRIIQLQQANQNLQQQVQQASVAHRHVQRLLPEDGA